MSLGRNIFCLFYHNHRQMMKNAIVFLQRGVNPKRVTPDFKFLNIITQPNEHAVCTAPLLHTHTRNVCIEAIFHPCMELF